MTNLRLMLGLMALGAAGCGRDAKPEAEPTVGGPLAATPDVFAVVEPAGAPALDQISIHQGSGGFATHLKATASRPTPGLPSVVDVTVVGLAGPGDHPFGFAWDRGDTRASVEIAGGIRCMTTNDNDAGTVVITSAPADGKLAPGARVAGHFHIRCSAEGKEGEPKQEFRGRFELTVPPV